MLSFKSDYNLQELHENKFMNSLYFFIYYYFQFRLNQEENDSIFYIKKKKIKYKKIVCIF